jgi:hypothetical protein
LSQSGSQVQFRFFDEGIIFNGNLILKHVIDVRMDDDADTDEEIFTNAKMSAKNDLKDAMLEL